MNEEQYKQVCKACDLILEMPGSTVERMSVPWLHVLREHPSLIKDYEVLFATSTTLADFFQVLAKKARSFGGWLRQFWLAMWSDGQSWSSSQALSKSVDVLFVSHLLSSADAGKPSDFYFGSLPELVQSESHRVVVALIDHSSASDMSRVRCWDGNTSTRVLLSGTLDLLGELSLYRRLRRESLRLAKLSRQEASGFMKKVFGRASLEAMSGGARTTLRMSEQVRRLVVAIKPKMLVVTYEGHAWERVVFAAARKVSPRLQCVGYQHAAVFRLQHSALRKLGPLFDPDVILTAGAVSKGQIEGSKRVHGIPVRVLGSSRAFGSSKGGKTNGPRISDDVDSKLAASSGNACLVLPEGIISECLILFEFSLKCAELMPDIHFIWRLHPLVTPKDLIMTSPRLHLLPANVEFSRVSLDEDFQRAKYALYRGSTAIVRAVSSGLQPIYLAQAGEMTIDPLYELDTVRAKVVDPIEIRSIIRNKKITAGEKNIISRYCEEFYSPIKPEVILAILP